MNIRSVILSLALGVASAAQGMCLNPGSRPDTQYRPFFNEQRTKYLGGLFYTACYTMKKLTRDIALDQAAPNFMADDENRIWHSIAQKTQKVIVSYTPNRYAKGTGAGLFTDSVLPAGFLESLTNSYISKSVLESHALQGLLVQIVTSPHKPEQVIAGTQEALEACGQAQRVYKLQKRNAALTNRNIAAEISNNLFDQRTDQFGSSDTMASPALHPKDLHNLIRFMNQHLRFNQRASCLNNPHRYPVSRLAELRKSILASSVINQIALALTKALDEDGFNSYKAGLCITDIYNLEMQKLASQAASKSAGEQDFSSKN